MIQCFTLRAIHLPPISQWYAILKGRRGNQSEHKGGGKFPHMAKSSCLEDTERLLRGEQLLKGPAGTWKKAFCITTPQRLPHLPFGAAVARLLPAILDPPHPHPHPRPTHTHTPPFSDPHFAIPSPSPVLPQVLDPIEHLVFHCCLIKFLHLAPLSLRNRGRCSRIPGPSAYWEGGRERGEGQGLPT